MRGGLKYGNKITVVDGITFMSAKESRRYSELRILERAKKIRDLEIQPVFPLIVNGQKVAKYIGDFSYYEGDVRIIEDTKSPITRKNPVYRLKNKLFRALYGFEITEV